MYPVRMLPAEQIQSNPHNARTHSKRQIKEIANSITQFGFTAPVLVDESFVLIAGHGRIEAAKLLALKAVPAVVLTGLSPAKARALMLADNKIAQHAGWDREKLAIELPALTEILLLEDLDISITGFEVAEVDELVLDFEGKSDDPADEVPTSTGPAVTAPGDLWLLGRHRLVCGSALNAEHLNHLMAGEQAAMAFLDPPYNVMVKSIGGRGKVRHVEFAMASGEMSPDAFQEFIRTALERAAAVSRDGAVHYASMDWRSVSELQLAGRDVYGEVLNLVVWVKSNAGQGSFYRSQHELIGVFRVGAEPHLNNVQLGRHGRNRSNVWHYPGVNTFRAGRMDDLAAHPTVKPTRMVADAIKDCTRRGEIVLDTFLGSGTTILAAERVGRRGFGIEYEPGYCDTAIRRWQAFTGKDAVRASDGRTFDEAAATSPSTAQSSPVSTIEGGRDVA